MLAAIFGSLSLTPIFFAQAAMIDNLKEAQSIGSEAAAQGNAAQAAVQAEESFNKLPEIRFQTTEESYVNSTDSAAPQSDKMEKLKPAETSPEKKAAMPPLSDESGKPPLKTGWAGFGRGYKIGVAKTLALWWNVMSLGGARFSEGDVSTVPGVLLAALAFPIVLLAAYIPMGIMSGIKGAKYGAEAPPKFDETVKSPWG